MCPNYHVNHNLHTLPLLDGFHTLYSKSYFNFVCYEIIQMNHEAIAKVESGAYEEFKEFNGKNSRENESIHNCFLWMKQQ